MRVDVWWSPVHASADFLALSTLLSPDERARAAAFHAPLARRAYVTAHALLRVVLGEVTATPPECVRLGRAPCARCGAAHGKPYVTDDDGVHFSLSHTHGRVAVAVGDVPLGVDVEQVAGEPVEHVLSAAERALFAALPPERRAAAFARTWTRKEAVLKATGIGLTTDPGSFDVGSPEGAPALTWQGPEVAIADLRGGGDSYAGSVATVGAACAVSERDGDALLRRSQPSRS